MKCSCCNNDYPKEDFFAGQDCFRCIYQQKLNRLKQAVPKKKPKPLCVICHKYVPISRRKFCSDHCLIVYKRKKQQTYWIRVMRA